FTQSSLRTSQTNLPFEMLWQTRTARWHCLCRPRVASMRWSECTARFLGWRRQARLAATTSPGSWPRVPRPSSAIQNRRLTSRRRLSTWRQRTATTGTRWVWLNTGRTTGKLRSPDSRNPWNCAKAATASTGSSWPWLTGSQATRKRPANGTTRRLSGRKKNTPKKRRVPAFAPENKHSLKKKRKKEPKEKKPLPTNKEKKIGGGAR